MVTKPKQRAKRTKVAKVARASVSFPVELYGVLERIANEKRVSVAWVVREAAAEYVADKTPLRGGS